MANPEGRTQKGGAAEPAAIHGVKLSDQRWYPVIVNDDGEILVATTITAPIDEITGGLLAIDTFHHEIHEGETFIASQVDVALADDGALTFHLTPGPSFSHLVFNGSNGGDATLEFLENPTITGGAAVTERNLKRTSPDVADTVVLANPTINAVGTTVFSCVLPGGTGGNATGGLLGLRLNSEFILDPDKTYAVRLTNIAGNTKAACLDVQWYEEDDN